MQLQAADIGRELILSREALLCSAMLPKACARLAALLPLVLACNAAPATTSQDLPASPSAPAAGPGGEAAAPASGPKIASSADTFEFGELRPGEQSVHVFPIQNLGDADLHIEGVRRT